MKRQNTSMLIALAVLIGIGSFASAAQNRSFIDQAGDFVLINDPTSPSKSINQGCWKIFYR